MGSQRGQWGYGSKIFLKLIQLVLVDFIRFIPLDQRLSRIVKGSQGLSGASLALRRLSGSLMVSGSLRVSQDLSGAIRGSQRTLRVSGTLRVFPDSKAQSGTQEP